MTDCCLTHFSTELFIVYISIIIEIVYIEFSKGLELIRSMRLVKRELISFLVNESPIFKGKGAKLNEIQQKQVISLRREYVY